MDWSSIHPLLAPPTDTEHVVHILRHCGWHTTRERGATFGEAAVRAVVRTCAEHGLDLSEIPHTVGFADDDHPRVVFREASHRRVFGGFRRPGDFWFSWRVREGAEDDCPACGGTGVSHYNPFHQCWACGVNGAEGRSSGRRGAPADRASAGRRDTRAEGR